MTLRHQMPRLLALVCGGVIGCFVPIRGHSVASQRVSPLRLADNSIIQSESTQLDLIGPDYGVKIIPPTSKISDDVDLELCLNDFLVYKLNLRLFGDRKQIDSRTMRILGISDDATRQMQEVIDLAISQRDETLSSSAKVSISDESRQVSISIPRTQLPQECRDQTIKRSFRSIAGNTIADVLVTLDHGQSVFGWEGGTHSIPEKSYILQIARDTPTDDGTERKWVLSYDDGTTAWRGDERDIPNWIRSIVNVEKIAAAW